MGGPGSGRRKDKPPEPPDDRPLAKVIRPEFRGHLSRMKETASAAIARAKAAPDDDALYDAAIDAINAAWSEFAGSIMGWMRSRTEPETGFQIAVHIGIATALRQMQTEFDELESAHGPDAEIIELKKARRERAQRDKHCVPPSRLPSAPSLAATHAALDALIRDAEQRSRRAPWPTQEVR